MKKTTKLSNRMYIIPADTKASKIASLGFGKKNNCLAYLQSTSLSPLNDKFYFALIEEVLDNNIRHFDFVADLNSLTADVVRVHTNGTTTTISLEFEIVNVKADVLEHQYKMTLTGKALEKALAKLPQGNHTKAMMTIQYRRNDNKGEELPERYLGKIEKFFFNDRYYFKNKFKSYTITEIK